LFRSPAGAAPRLTARVHCQRQHPIVHDRRRSGQCSSWCVPVSYCDRPVWPRAHGLSPRPWYGACPKQPNDREAAKPDGASGPAPNWYLHHPGRGRTCRSAPSYSASNFNQLPKHSVQLGCTATPPGHAQGTDGDRLPDCRSIVRAAGSRWPSPIWTIGGPVPAWAGAASAPGRRLLTGSRNMAGGWLLRPTRLSQTGPKGRHRLPTAPPFGALSAWALWNTRRRFDPSSSPSASFAAAACSLREDVGN
jgi:hypothetical protein